MTIPSEFTSSMLAAAEVPTCPLETGTCGAQLVTVERRHFCVGDAMSATHGVAGDESHSCSCGETWDEVITTHGVGMCGVTSHDVPDHDCLCDLVEHNRIFIGGQNLRSHQCQYDGCGHAWAAP